MEKHRLHLSYKWEHCLGATVTQRATKMTVWPRKKLNLAPADWRGSLTWMWHSWFTCQFMSQTSTYPHGFCVAPESTRLVLLYSSRWMVHVDPNGCGQRDKICVRFKWSKWDSLGIWSEGCTLVTTVRCRSGHIQPLGLTQNVPKPFYIPCSLEVYLRTRGVTSKH